MISPRPGRRRLVNLLICLPFPALYQVGQKSVMLATAVLFVFCLTAPVSAQSVGLPLPRLLTMMPMGGTVGSETEVTISGENVDDAGDLLFTHSGLTARRKMNANGQPEPHKYLVQIAADCPPGIYEARLMSRLGISSPRVFCVDTLSEVNQLAPNTTLSTAMPVPVNSICNAVMTARSIDHYTFSAKKGQRYLVHCSARGIDSKLEPVLIIADSAGRDRIAERRGEAVDFTATQDGTHVIKVHELTFKGGPAFYYRLSLRELAANDPLPRFAATRTVSSFSWPPAGLPVTAASREVEPNNPPSKAQKVSLPLDIAGSFFPAADVDTYEFSASKGEVWWVEVASERLGRPTDPAVLVQRVLGEGAAAEVADVVEFSDIPAPIKPSSNGYSYDGPPYDGGSLDIIGKLEIKEDGVYRLQISDLFGGTRNDDRNEYRLCIRKADPDFAVAAWGLHMELRNGDRNAVSKPMALRAGVTMAFEVVAVRRDGFDGDIELVMEGLPAGVSARGLTIPAGKTRGIMLITADPTAPAGFANASFYGKSTVNGATVIRPVQMATMAWPIVDAWGEIPSPRLTTDVAVSVTRSELAPLTIAPSQPEWNATVGQKLTIPLLHQRRSEFSGSVLQLKTLGLGFEAVPRFDVSLNGDQSEATLDLAALKIPPGDYLIAFYGSLVAKYRYNPEAVTAAEAELKTSEAEAAAAAAELQSATSALADSTSDSEASKGEASKRVAAATERKKFADAAATAAVAKLKSATELALPRDTADIMITEPITIHVRPAEVK